MKNVIFLIGCGVLVVVPVLFVLNKVYKDGVMGRASLLAISFAAASFLFEAALGEAFNPAPGTVMLVVAFATFICWHLWRFHRRVLKRYDQTLPPGAWIRE